MKWATTADPNESFLTDSEEAGTKMRALSIMQPWVHAFLWHALRNTMADLRDAGFPLDYFFLFKLPVYVRTAP